MPVASRSRAISVHVARVLAALLLLQTLYFKFTAAPESVWIFERLGAEPWGRIGSGLVELAVSALLLLPSARLQGLGGLLAVGVMAGAIASHLLVLGIDVQGDGGALFAMAGIVALSSGWVAWNRRSGLVQLIRGGSEATL